MFSKRNAFIYLWCVAVAGAVIAFSAPENRLGMAVMFAVLVALIALAAHPKSSRLIGEHARFVSVAGMVLVGASLALLVGGLAFPQAVRPDALAWEFISLLMAGLLLIQLPRIVRQTQRAKQEVESAKARPAPPARPAQAFDDVFEAARIPMENWPAVLRTVGPLLLLPWGLVFAAPFVDVDSWKPQPHHQTVWIALAGLVVVVLLDVCLQLLAAIKWARFVASRRLTPFGAVPIRPLWGVFWRLLIFGSVMQSVGKLKPWVQTHMPELSPSGVATVVDLAGFLVDVIASPFALILVAVALGAADKSTLVVMRVRRYYGPRFYLSAAIILAPLRLCNWLSDIAPDIPKNNPMTLALDGAWLVIAPVTLVMATTFLTRAYLRGEPSCAENAAIA